MYIYGTQNCYFKQNTSDDTVPVLLTQDQYFSDPAVLPTIVLLFFSYGAALTPWMYALSFLFHSPATAYIVLFCLNFFSGFALLIVDAIIVYINGLDNETGYTIPHLLTQWLALSCTSVSIGPSREWHSSTRANRCPIRWKISGHL